jgi:hypothetical protein|tara:strand:+ start:239 stop:463 length:225 start_codon:yes stop_codon:yes gene_type:complete
MSNELVFIIGFSIGSLIGVISISIFASRRIVDLHSEVRDLRVQRKLLKDELQKPQGKPTPRKKRNRVQPTKKRI